MSAIRCRLRLCTTIWLLCQVGSLLALLPRNCCAAHQQSATSEGHSCHRQVAAAHCPMRSTAGEACPMHRQQPAQGGATETCTMRSSCDGPMAALLVLLSNHGVLTAPLTVVPDFHVSSLVSPTREHLAGLLTPPDSPPPRA
jgi:hypothetical protein